MSEEREAGRELDRLIGEKVFGYYLYHYDKDYERNNYWQLLYEGLESVAMDHGRGWGERKTPEEAWEDCPHFSTEIAAAWEIVEHYRAQGWLWDVKDMPPGYPYYMDEGCEHKLFRRSYVSLTYMPQETTEEIHKRIW